MDVKISPSQLNGVLNVVASKSQSHRAMIAAGLASGVSTLHNILDCDDLDATKNALTKLGVTFHANKVSGGLKSDTSTHIDANESGSTLRFMIPLALLLNQPITFTGKGRLPQRPLQVYESLFKSRVTYTPQSNKALPLLVKGPLSAGEFHCPGNVSSQFISGLLFALPLLKEDSVITLTSPLESKGYVDLTIDMLKTFGITITEKNNHYIVPGNQHYTSQKITIEGDFSQAAFFIVGALINGTIDLKNLNPASKQGDKHIIDSVRAMGANITYDGLKAVYTVSKSRTYGTRIDLTDIPDLGPILMVLAALSEGTTTFKNISRLRLKESDRLAVMIENLTKLGVKTKLKTTTLTVYGQTQLLGNQTLDAHGDHRIVMALSIAALKADGSLIIKGSDAITKSYPTFFDDFSALGGCVETIK